MNPFAFHLMAKPAGAACNLACDYCFFRRKAALYPDSRFRMSEEVLEAYVCQYIQAQRGPEVMFSWQGGEPTLMGLDFYRRAVAVQHQFQRPGQVVVNSLQTNGILLDEEWCRFFRNNNFLIGLSLDGPEEVHDRFRRDKGGNATFEAVMRAVRLLSKHGVEFNILTTVNAANQARPLEVYRFLRNEVGARFLQFIPVIERTESGGVSEHSIGPRQWGRFLIEIFEEWVRRDVGRITVQIFEAALAAWLGAPPPLCMFAETCGRALVVEHNGDVYACDHFVDREHSLGNLLETPLVALVNQSEQVRFGLNKRDRLPRFCQDCEVRFVCQGECPKNRFAATPDGEPGLNYLCGGYRAFFRHIDGPMRRLAADILRPSATRAQKVGVNSPCPCGSGLKFKRCHGAVTR
jgi:uncharacterized protein